MDARGRSPFVLAACLALLSQFVVPVTANAQAWVPPKRTGIVSVAFRNIFVREHATDTGKRFYAGQITQNLVSTDIDYGLSRRWALNLSLPFIYGKYTGPSPHRDPGQVEYLDDGHYHGGFQDLRVGLRYNLVRDRPFVFTPFVEGIIPSGYDTYGHALRGRNLRELLVGANVGRDLEPLLPNAYFQVRVSHAFVQPVLDYSGHHTLDASHNRTNIDAEVGIRLTERVIFSGNVHLQEHHGGLTWVDCSPLPLGACFSYEEWHLHSQLFDTDALDVGAGISFGLSPAVSVFASFLTTPWARNGHPISRGITVGMNWRFDTRRRRVLPPEPPRTVETASYGFR
jgi:hypothetical protein